MKDKIVERVVPLSTWMSETTRAKTPTSERHDTLLRTQPM